MAKCCEARWLDLSYVRLVDGLAFTSHPPGGYAALSYVWGQPQDQPSQTTISNFRNHPNGIKFSNLPKTFQDAIFVSANMNLKYIWIDRYCIIQDDKSDVAEQLSLMPVIYANAAITISAAVAQDTHAGFLQDHVRPGQDSKTFHLSCKRKSYLSFRTSTVQIRPLAINAKDPVETRPWCLQESLLSNRLLIYGATQIRWACRELHATDGGPQYRSFHAAIPMSKGRPKYISISANQLNSDDWPWDRVAVEYSGRSLTFPTDKLIAIAAIAEAFFKRPQNESDGEVAYLAGIWHFSERIEVLAKFLMWRPESVQANALPATYIAPSWSWASHAGAATYESRLPSAVASFEVKLATCTPTSIHLPFGNIVSGYIKCCGLTQSARLTFENKSWYFRSPLKEALLVPCLDAVHDDAEMLIRY
jgi:hypothetical protein